jgi:hypothetical protein
MRSKFYLIVTYLIILFIHIGCSTTRNLKLPEKLPPIVKQYKHITIRQVNQGLIKSGIQLSKDELFVILVDQFLRLNGFVSITVGNQSIHPHRYYSTAPVSGQLSLGSYLRRDVDFGVDVIVFKEKNWEHIEEFFRLINNLNPKNEEIELAIASANRFNEIEKMSIETSQAITILSEEIKKTKEKSIYTDDQLIEKLEIYQHKLAQLTNQLEQLEILKRELKEKDFREKDLLEKLETARRRPPIVFIGSPKSGFKAEYKIINLYGVIEDEKAIDTVEFFINGELNEAISKRGILVSQQTKPKRIEFNEKITLKNGKNTLLVKATDSDGFTTEKEVVLSYAESRKNVWAVVIGIDSYQNVRHLKYAAKDATAFYQYLIRKIRIPPENVSLLLNEQAHLYKMRSILGTHLKRKAGKDDMVMIFFAGHGAAEKDALSPDGDGLEKYILPYDADLKDLYASALPMSEVSKIFSRIYSERILFIVDACYSGASGGRTISISGMRANISDGFMDRISSGKGRVIITASGANEVSTEKDDLKHGVFTYFLLEGLKGAADFDNDGIITVDEAYNYVSINVPMATNQAQHPVKKGSVEGQLIMGIVE